MNTLVDIAEFVEHVLRLDLDTPVRGYDGTEIGPSNEQAQALANRTIWLKKKCEDLQTKLTTLGERNYVASVNKKTGNITITYEDIGAAAAIHTHTPSDIETTADAGFVSEAERLAWDGKQEQLVSGETLKTVLGMSLLGKGDIQVTAKDILTSPELLFVSEKDKVYWSGKQNQLESGKNINTLHGKSLLGDGDVKLTFADVDADKSGTAAGKIADHLTAEDPHSQYLTESRGEAVFVPQSTANKPNGFLKLDANGFIPPDLATLYEARYEIVQNEEERHAIVKAKNLTMALQLDENRIYYLGSDEDPSVEDNWRAGRSTDLSAVISVFGRSGIIVPENGDYNTDQITETQERVFVTPTEKKDWTGKQTQLSSGKNIKSINGGSILGSGDLVISPKSIGAAKEIHGHNVDDIETNDNKQFISAEDRNRWNSNQSTLVSGETIKTINGDDILGSGDMDITPLTIGAAEKQHKHKATDIQTDSDSSFVSATEKKTWNAKQEALKSGTNIKTVNGETLLGEGNVSVTPESIGAAEEVHKHLPSDIETDEDNQFITQAEKKLYAGKQAKLVSGTNIATVFGKSVLSSGDITLKDASDLSEVIKGILVGKDGVDVSLDKETGIITIKGPGEHAGGEGGTGGSLSKLTVVEVPNVVVGTDYKYRATDDFVFDFMAYALKEVIISEAHTDTINYDKLSNNLIKTPLPAADKDGMFPFSSPSHLTYKRVSNSFEKYGTVDIQNPGGDAALISFAVDPATADIIPVFTKDYTPSGYTLTSSAIYPGFYPWKAFQRPLTDTERKRVPNYEYWSDLQIWRNRKNPVYLAIEYWETLEVTAYSFQNFESLYWTGASTPPTAWQFQGRNRDSESWTTIDAQNDQTIMKPGDTWSTYILDKPVNYKQYRILVLDVVLPTARAVIPRWQLHNEPYALLKDKAGQYLTVTEDGELETVPSTDSGVFKSKGFKKTPVPIQISDLTQHFPIQVCTLDSGGVTESVYKNSDQIAIHNPMENLNIWESLIHLEGKTFYHEDDKTDLKTAITVDGSRYRVLTKGEWVDIGPLTNDTPSAKLLNEQGMLFIELANVSEEQWKTLLDQVGEDAKVGIAYGNLISQKTQSLTPKEMSLGFKRISDWAKLSTEKVEITLSKRYITFKPLVEGTFKFCYRFM